MSLRLSTLPRWLWAAAALAALLLAGLLTQRLTRQGAPPAVAAAPHLHGAPEPIPPASLEYIRAGFESYEAIRLLLVRDSLEGLPSRAAELAQAFRAAAAVQGAAPNLVRALHDGALAAMRLGNAQGLEPARTAFSAVTETVVALASSDPRLQEGWHLFQCPMVKGFNQWVQPTPQLQNPYMGQRMETCGSALPWSQGDAAVGHGEHSGEEVAYYTCPMHPAVRKDAPGKCPLCGMDLTAVTQDEVRSGVVRIDEARKKILGVITETVRVAPMDRSFRALGRVTYDETQLQDVTLKLDGYIHGLKVDATGQPVKRGDVLFSLYSPELYAAQQEYLLARGSESAAGESLVRAARKRLELWGLPRAQVERIGERGQPLENVPFLSPASGYVIEKNVVEGAAVKAGERLFRIAPLERVWVEADVYEQDLPRVKVGQTVDVSLPFLPGTQLEGKVTYVYPTLEGKTRTGKVRIELPNPEQTLKPDMYADLQFRLESAPRLQVPESAVLYTGPRRLVFLDLGEGRFRPQEVKLGARSERGYEVLEGLEEGDRVVTSGNFLIAAESRIRSAADTLSGAGHDSH